MGLYEPGEGAILVDGTTLAQLDMHWWRRQLGVVMQDAGASACACLKKALSSACLSKQLYLLMWGMHARQGAGDCC